MTASNSWAGPRQWPGVRWAIAIWEPGLAWQVGRWAQV